MPACRSCSQAEDVLVRPLAAHLAADVAERAQAPEHAVDVEFERVKAITGGLNFGLVRRPGYRPDWLEG